MCNTGYTHAREDTYIVTYTHAREDTYIVTEMGKGSGLSILFHEKYREICKKNRYVEEEESDKWKGITKEIKKKNE